MPKYYCDYCDVFLTHDSPSVRKTHNGGRKHKENVRMFYQAWMEEQAQKLVDATTRAFTQQRLLNQSAAAAGMAGMIMPPRAMLPPGMMPPGMRPPAGMPFPFPAMPGMPPRPGMPPPFIPPTGPVPTGIPPVPAALRPPQTTQS